MAEETYVLFELAGGTYGLRSAEVRHIEMLEHVTPVPNAAAFVEGVVFSRGQVIPAINLRLRFGFPREPFNARTRLIVTQAGQRTVALIVDSAREFRSLADSAISPVEQSMTGVEGNYVRAVTTLNERMVFLLDLDGVLNFSGSTIPGAAVPQSKPLTTAQPSAAVATH